MPTEQGITLARQMEQTLERVQGISSARILLDDRDDILEVHLVGPDLKSPKLVVRDVETLLCAHFGVRIDYRKISLVQFSTKVEEPRLRVRFVSAQHAVEPIDQAQVVLECNGAEYSGCCPVDTAADPSATRATAAATMTALEKVLGPVVELVMQDAHAVPVSDGHIALVVVLASTRKGQERLSGTCFVRNCLLEATAKATLDAVNRRLVVWAAS